MGQEQSALIEDGTPPITLSERSLSAVAQLIKDGRARRIVVMTGAGLSTAAGIPDFRSPKSGLYANLSRLNLPYAESVFDISYFRQNPDPFYVLAKELYPGNYSPTISHVFIALLAEKKLLRMLFTQNIDCLERQAGVPGELIVEAHGSFASQRCIDCKAPFPDDKMKQHVFKGEVPRCVDVNCQGLVKPDIVFFGEQLPEQFHNNSHVPSYGDLILVIGTSLTVHPFASLPEMAGDATPRVLFNLERVGSLGTRRDDVLVLEDCDSGIRKFADHLGWRDELESKWRKLVGEKEVERQLRSAEERRAAMQNEVEDLADRVGEGLRFDDEAGSRDGAGSSADEQDSLFRSEELRATGSELDTHSSPHEAEEESTNTPTLKENLEKNLEKDLGKELVNGQKPTPENKDESAASPSVAAGENSNSAPGPDPIPKKDTVDEKADVKEEVDKLVIKSAGKSAF